VAFVYKLGYASDLRAEDDVDARAMRGGAAPTQRLTPLSGSSHHGEPLTAERLAGCSRLYIRQRRSGALGGRACTPVRCSESENGSSVVHCERPGEEKGGQHVSELWVGRAGGSPSHVQHTIATPCHAMWIRATSQVREAPPSWLVQLLSQPSLATQGKAVSQATTIALCAL